jgi:hypothetical protein
MQWFAAAVAVLCVSGAFAEDRIADPELDQLARWMTGSFSSQAQSESDPDFFHIVLHMARIWPDRTDGVWLYVEQAAADSADTPYRQRVYHVRRVGEDVFGSSVYTFPDPLSRTGSWKKETPFSDLEPSDLTARAGCTIYLRPRDDGTYEGSTLGRLCTSNLRGSTWASSEVVVAEDALHSWDRGWDDSGHQIWGAEKAGYRFDRVPASE